MLLVVNYIWSEGSDVCSALLCQKLSYIIGPTSSTELSRDFSQLSLYNGLMSYSVTIEQIASLGKTIFESSFGLNFQAELRSPQSSPWPHVRPRYRLITTLSSCCAARWRINSGKVARCWSCGSESPWSFVKHSFVLSEDEAVANKQFAELLELLGRDPLEAVLEAAFLVNCTEHVFSEIKSGRRIRELVLNQSVFT